MGSARASLHVKKPWLSTMYGGANACFWSSLNPPLNATSILIFLIALFETGTGNDIATNTDGSSSVLRHVQLINTADGINIVGRPPRLDHMTVVSSAASGVKLSGFFKGHFTVSHCNFSKNQENGIDIDLGESNATVDVTSTTMNGNGATGMSLRNVTSGTVRFLNNTVNNNPQQGLHLDHINATVVVANSSFVNNTRLSAKEGYTLKLSDVHGGHVDIVHNVFVDNLNYRRIYPWDDRRIRPHHVVRGAR